MTKQSYYPKPDQNIDFAKLETQILDFWQKNDVFNKSIEIRDDTGLEEDNVSPVLEPCALKDHTSCRHGHEEKSEFVFYDGPPFANGLPHYGHLLTGFIKDIFARYQTMKGKKVERKFGWDTHGLPVEMETEKELGVSGQIAIQDYGIEKFNEACEKSVMKYADEWEKYVTRQGRWVDFENDYKTKDVNYMESVLWAFKELHKKGLLYEDYRVVPYSWACQTPLSNFETRMDNSYREKKSKAVTLKFELTSESKKNLVQRLIESYRDVDLHEEIKNPLLENIGKIGKVFFYAWTTTPWTLPSNLALGIGKNIQYTIYGKHIKGEDRYSEVVICSSSYGPLSEDFEVIRMIHGSRLLGLSYEPLFPYFTEAGGENSFKIVHGDFVTTDEGTGIVHLAPAFGEDDQLLCKSLGIPTICPVDEGGKFAPAKTVDQNGEVKYVEVNDLTVGDLTISLNGKQVFETNDDIIKYLKAKSLWIKTDQYLHNYPHCWRTDTPLIYKAVSSWYVKVTDFKDRMVELNSGKPVFKLENIPATIETSRIRGNLAYDENFSELLAMFSDREVREHYYYAPQQYCDEQGTRDYIDYFKDQTSKGLPRFCLFDKESGEFIGLAGFCFYNPKHENFENGKVELVYQFVKKSWGKGLAPEIAKALVDFAFKYYPVEEVLAAAVGTNEKSHKVLQKVGFELKSRTKNTYPKAKQGVEHEECLFIYKKKENTGINWIPDHIKDGQFGKWLEGARDWSISRNRFWGCPVPVWTSSDSKYPRIDVYGSLDQLEADFGVRPKNLHRPHIDNLTRLNPDDPRSDASHAQHANCSVMKRVTDVLDCWFESGSMPYAQCHYPFENKERFEENFPADFITEYLAQTRGWFYTMMVLSTALFDRAPFKNVICHGTILDENAQKLSKRLRNYPDPIAMFDEIGSDALRYYMISQPVMRGQELKVDQKGKSFRDALRSSIKPLTNAFNFFCLYANSDGIKAKKIEYSREFTNPLDDYILAKLKAAVTKIDESMKNYDTISACTAFDGFFDVLNNWYIRRSRQRFWQKDSTQEKQDAYDVLYSCLVYMCEAGAPLLPFTTEHVWKGLRG